MNREIKFRAWDLYDVTPKMITPNNGDFIGWHAPFNWNACYKVMQYTGLKDKNGVEIYEGDIIGRDRYINKVIVHDGLGFYTYSVCNPERLFKLERDSITEYDEVIGNIYENPELL